MQFRPCLLGVSITSVSGCAQRYACAAAMVSGMRGLQRPFITLSFMSACREKDAAALVRTIVSVVAHCHLLGVVHRYDARLWRASL